MTGAARNVAIVMDGNARWAKRQGLDTPAGHREGSRALKRTVRNAVKLGIAELTVFAFSTENWSRPADEVDGLMAMFSELIASETPELDEHGVRMTFIGRREGMSRTLLTEMDAATERTAHNDRMKLFVAFNYGGRAEIVDAAVRFAAAGEAVTAGGVPGLEAERAFARYLYAPAMAEPDLVIRTSGERRLSNFLLWQTAYSELYFTDVLWPDFDHEHLAEALDAYEQRQRRFGAR